MDAMDVDEETVFSPVDGSRRQRAAEKLCKQLGGGHGEQSEDTGLSYEKAREILRKNLELCTGNKISAENAFDLQGIDALRVLVFHENAVDSARCGESHFQQAGMGLDVGMRIFIKRVDATYNLALSRLGDRFKRDPKDEEVDGDEEGARDEEGKAADGDDTAPGPEKSKTKKRQAATSAEQTLRENADLRHQVKDVTLDMDPFFIRTSRLIDENSPQGLLLHNLRVLSGAHVVFNANVRPQEVLAQAHADGLAAGASQGGRTMVDLSALPRARGLLVAASSASLNPGIGQLYELLEPEPQPAAVIDPEELLRNALAENPKNTRRIEHAALEQVLEHVEDAPDVDMMDADGMDADFMHGGSGEAQEAEASDPAGDMGVGGAEHTAAGYDSPGYGGGAGSGDEGAYGVAGGAESPGDDLGDQQEADGTERGGSDDESATLSLLGGISSSSMGTTAGLQRTWWKTRAKRAGSCAAPGAKPRARKQKAEDVPLDWHNPPAAPQSEDVRHHTYKTSRKEALSKLLVLEEEPSRPEDLIGFFSTDPVVGMASSSHGGQRHWRRQGGLGTVRDVWCSLLMADNALERQRRREERAGPPRGGATPGLHQGAGGMATAPSDTEGSAWEAGAGEEYGAGAGFDGGYDGDGGAPGLGGGVSDDDDDDNYGGGSGFGAGAPTLEELLQPPRRVQRATIKCDKTAGVADVATLKANLETSLKSLAVSSMHRRQSAPNTTRALSFQNVLDKVSEHAASAGEAKPSGAGPLAVAGAGSKGNSLAGVSTHLAFICLLHLANEKGLALSNGGDLNTLHITGLGDLVAAR